MTSFYLSHISHSLHFPTVCQRRSFCPGIFTSSTLFLSVFRTGLWPYNEKLSGPQCWGSFSAPALIPVRACVHACVKAPVQPRCMRTEEGGGGDKWIPCLQENTLEAQENFVVYGEHVKPIKSELSSCCSKPLSFAAFSSLASSVTTQGEQVCVRARKVKTET